MIKEPRLVAKIQGAAGRASKQTTREWMRGDLFGERAFTETLITRTRDGINSLDTGGIRVKMRSLTDMQPGSEEKRLGADFVGVLTVDRPSIRISKGFLAQAKMETNRNRGKLIEQCNKMLAVTHASYVVLYGQDGVNILPAQSVVSSHGISLDGLSSMTYVGFMREHVKCFLGDYWLTNIAPQSLEGLRERLGTRMAFEIRISFQENEDGF